MNTLDALLLLVVCAVGTWATRAGPLLALADRPFPPLVNKALRNVGPAVLAALTVSLAFGGGGTLDLDGAVVGALLAAGLAAWRTRNLTWTLVAGMVVLWVLDAVI